MIVEPDLTNHPKFVQLKSKVGDLAMELLVRLWTHCQQNKRGQLWHGANSDYVEVVCTGRNRKGSRVFEALRDCGWIHEREDGIEVHDWDKHNASLIARWKRDLKPAQTLTQPSTQTPAQTPDRTGQDTTGPDTTGDDRVNNNCGQMTPTLEQAIAWCQKNDSGYTAEQVKAGFDSLEATKHPGGWWKFGNSMVTDWRSALSSRLALFADRKNPARPAAAKQPDEPPVALNSAAVTLAEMREAVK